MGLAKMNNDFFFILFYFISYLFFCVIKHILDITKYTDLLKYNWK